MLNKAYLVALREFIENLRTKTFWIGIFSFPVLLVVAFVVPAWLEKTREVRKYAVLDYSGWLLQKVEEHAAMPDLEKVLQMVVRQYRSGVNNTGNLPQPLQELGPILAKLSDEEITLFAQQLASLLEPGSVSTSPLPPVAKEALKRFHNVIQRWWVTLPAEEAEKIGSNLAKSQYKRMEIPRSVTDPEKYLNDRLLRDELFAYFVIGKDPIRDCHDCKYVSKNLTDTDLYDWFSNHASAVIRSARLTRENIDEKVAAWIEQPLTFEKTRISTAGRFMKVESTDIVRQWAPVAFVYLLWVAIFTSAQILLTNTIEEKSNRIIEVLLSSVSSLELMTGKILGIALTGLTVIASWALFFIAGINLLPKLLHHRLGINLSQIVSDPVYLVSFLAYFIMGYLLHASILAAIGSVCNSLKEAQNLMQPLILLLIIPFLAMVPIAKDPHGILAKVLSYIPVFTPFVMMNRSAGDVPWTEYAATSVLLVVSIIATFWAAARIFRIGILMTGKPPNIRDILKLIRMGAGSIPSTTNSHTDRS